MMKRLIVFKTASILGAFLLLFTANLSQAGGARPLEAPAGAAGADHNAEGIKHCKMGMWEKAELHFGGAAKENIGELNKLPFFWNFPGKVVFRPV